MAKKNAYLDRQKRLNDACFAAGMETGRQQIIDMMSLALRDPKVMGKDTFGRDRLLQLIRTIGQYMDEYALAWKKHDEADYWQDKMDDALAEAFGSELHDSFMTRYEYAAKFDYGKRRWTA